MPRRRFRIDERALAVLMEVAKLRITNSDVFQKYPARFFVTESGCVRACER